MSGQAALAIDDFWFGDTEAAEQRPWLSPVLVGLGAPVVLGLVLAPQLLFGVSWMVFGGLFFLLGIAAGAYALSVIFPGQPRTLIVRPKARMLSVISCGLLANSTVEIPFGEVARIERAQSVSIGVRDVTSYLHIETKDGTVWSIPADVTSREIDALVALVRARKRTR